ncbi:MAG: PEGA domain-containing protein [Deltaproteobacteria bacterium]|nr:PEGA domain-containing protein [Deltaproteobacteria bacterium]
MTIAARVLLISLLCGFFFPLTVAAEEDEIARDEEIKRKAKAFFTRGELLFEAGDFLEAAEAFKMAYETLPHPAVTGNIAICYDKAGMWPKAVTFYRIFLADTVVREKNSSLQERLNELEQLVGELEIECREPGCHIRIDGIDEGETPVKVVLLPGRHRVEALVDGNVLVSEETEVKTRDTLKVELEVEPPPEPEVEETDVNPDHADVDNRDGAPFGAGFWTSVGLTGAAGASILVFGLLTVDARDDYKASNWLDRDAKDRGEQFKLTTNIMIGITAAAAAASVVFAIYDLRGDDSGRDVALIGPGPGLGLSFSRNF